MTDIMEVISENALYAFFGVVGMILMVTIIASTQGEIGGLASSMRVIIPIAWGFVVIWILIKGLDKLK